MNDTETAFEKEYKALMAKYKVRLVVETRSDEWGSQTSVRFEEQGKYRNINYTPDYCKHDKGYCGMGQ